MMIVVIFVHLIFANNLFFSKNRLVVRQKGEKVEKNHSLSFKKNKKGMEELAKIILGRHLHCSVAEGWLNRKGCVITKEAVFFEGKRAYDLGLYAHQTYRIDKVEFSENGEGCMFLSFELRNLNSSLMGFIGLLYGEKSSSSSTVRQIFDLRDIKFIDPKIYLDRG